MNKEEIISTLRKYNFDPNEYMIISTASMVLQGIKDKAHDIDISVTSKYYEYLKNNYKVEAEKEFDGVTVYYIDGVINFGTNFYDENEKIMYEGFPLQSLSSIRQLKRYLNREKDLSDINLINKYLELNPLALAYIGDAAYEIEIRKSLIDKGLIRVNDLYKISTSYVSAKSQASLLNKLINNNYLTEEELDIVRKGRNAKSHKAPKNTDIVTYKHATGFEALIGFLYLQNKTKRIKDIVKEIIGE